MMSSKYIYILHIYDAWGIRTIHSLTQKQISWDRQKQSQKHTLDENIHDFNERVALRDQLVQTHFIYSMTIVNKKVKQHTRFFLFLN